MNAMENKSFNENIDIIDLSDIEFSVDGDIKAVDFATATCSEIRDGIRYTTTVGCFLCGEERAQERCQRVLSRRLDELDPWVQF
ncbi:hypothetical protein [uncultured Winogradskyella sp.]|uniref:hypothetical protein n=1 Tax=uncultured Winogradskyella sp. TaxID=395353 RepID=UPI00262FE893|nr:hypothetical protein [uncultured Winogradskyella sp.]